MAGKVAFSILLAFLYLWEVDAGPIEGFYLGIARSDVFYNKVITGVKFGREESKICLQIKQGKMGPLGSIEGACDGWTPCNTSYPFHPASNDFVMIDIDDITGTKDLVLTGVTLGLSRGCTGDEHLSLRLEYSPFNFETGQLGNYRTPQPSSSCHTNEININAIDGPLNQRKLEDLKTDSTSKSFLRFSMLNTLEKVVGKMLDDQTVEDDQCTPLTAQGLSYRVSPGVGISSLKIQSVDDSFMNEGVRARTDTFHRFKRSFDDYDTTDGNTHYEYFSLLLIPIGIIVCICLCCRCLCNCCCPKPQQVIVNTAPVFSSQAPLI